jgi:hypothetical protein
MEAPVEITFLTSTGVTIEQQPVLPSGSRTTIAVDDIPGLEGAEVSTVVRQGRTARREASRPMAW